MDGVGRGLFTRCPLNGRGGHRLDRSEACTPILVGGNSPTRIVPLAARYADVWNAWHISPEAFRDRSEVLDDRLRELGRAPHEVTRGITLVAVCGRTDAELERSAAPLRRWQPQFLTSPLEELLQWLRSDRHALTGTPDDL